MDKMKLLDVAAQDDECCMSARVYARRSLTDDAIAPLSAAAKKWKARFDNVCLFGGIALCVILTFALPPLGITPPAPTVDLGRVGEVLPQLTISAGLSALITVFVLILVVMIADMLGYGKSVRLLTPIADTSYCEHALAVLEEGGPLAAAWRDQALQERSQLYLFDLEVITALGRVHESQNARAKDLARQQQACRKLHGVGPLRINPSP